jgi:hypothetical protein
VNRLNDSAYQANTLVPRQGAKVVVAFVDQAMLMNHELQKRFYKDPTSIADIMDFRKAQAKVRGMLITDALDQPPLISAIVIEQAEMTHFSEGASDKPATIEGYIVGKNLTGSSIELENPPDSLEIKQKGRAESNRLYFRLTSHKAVLPGSAGGVLNFVVVRSNDVAKQSFSVSYTIAEPTLTDIKPRSIKQGDPETEFTLTGTGFVKGLFSVTGCERIKVKDPAWQSDKEIKIKIEVPAEAAKGPCELRVKNGDNFVSGPQTLTIEKAKEKDKEKEN